MDLTHLIVALAVLSIVWVIVTRFIPLPDPFGTIFNIVMAVVAILLLLQAVGWTHIGLG